MISVWARGSLVPILYHHFPEMSSLSAKNLSYHINACVRERAAPSEQKKDP